MERTAARLLVDCLEAQGCDRVFTVPGESFLPVLDALRDSTIQTVTCRQEGGAAFMACADGALNAYGNGRPGVAFVTRGPGATNASIGMHVAFQDSQPMVLFIGDVDRRMRDREGFQEMDFAQFFGPMAKWTARIDDAARIPEYVARAFATAVSGRPGPVALALPEDMLHEAGLTAQPRPMALRPAQAPCPDAMSTLLALLADATNPVAIVGGGGWNGRARDHFTAFASRIGLPVATAFRRQDAVDPGAATYAGNLGYGPNPRLAERIRQADLLLVVGARMGEATTDGYTLVTPEHPGQVLVHVHPDPEELHRVYRTDLAICADPADFAESANLWGDADFAPFAAGAAAHQDWLDWSTPTAEPAFALDMAACMATAKQLIPADAIICNGAGNFSGWWHRYWHYAGAPSQLAPTSGAMGYGLPAAVAAALRHPGRCVIAVAGDGDFLMNAQELATAAQHGADLLVLVMDNGAYGTIRMHQEREYPGRVVATDLANPDFAALGAAFGAWSKRVETTAQFADALAEALELPGLRLLHCRTDLEQLAASGLKLSTLRDRAR